MEIKNPLELMVHGTRRIKPNRKEGLVTRLKRTGE